MTLIEGKKYLSTADFAREIGKSWTATRNYVLRGIIKPNKVVGKHMYFTEEQLKKFKEGYYVPIKKEGD